MGLFRDIAGAAAGGMSGGAATAARAFSRSGGSGQKKRGSKHGDPTDVPGTEPVPGAEGMDDYNSPRNGKRRNGNGRSFDV